MEKIIFENKSKTAVLEDTIQNCFYTIDHINNEKWYLLDILRNLGHFVKIGNLKISENSKEDINKVIREIVYLRENGDELQGKLYEIIAYEEKKEEIPEEKNEEISENSSFNLKKIEELSLKIVELECNNEEEMRFSEKILGKFLEFAKK